MDKEVKIQWIGLGIICGLIISVLFSILNNYTWHDFNTILDLFLNENKVLILFRDFHHNYAVMINYSPFTGNAEFPPVPHFPFTFLLGALFGKMNENIALYLFLFIFVAFFLIYASANLRTNSKANQLFYVAIFTCSYPFLFAVQRANYENLVFIFVALFIYSFNNKKLRLLNIVFLACAIAMKAYPAAFLVLYFSGDRRKDILYVLALSFILTILSYASLGGGVITNFKAHLSALTFFNLNYAIGNWGLAYGHSLYGAIKNLIIYFNPTNYKEWVLTVYVITPILALGIFAGITAYIISYETVFWKKVTLIVFGVCFLPHVSSDYKLLLIYLPLFLFINDPVKNKADFFYIIMFILVLIPKEIPLFTVKHVDSFINLVNMGVLITPLIMLLTMVLIVVEGLQKHVFQLRHIKEDQNLSMSKH